MTSTDQLIRELSQQVAGLSGRVSALSDTVHSQTQEIARLRTSMQPSGELNGKEQIQLYLSKCGHKSVNNFTDNQTLFKKLMPVLGPLFNLENMSDLSRLLVFYGYEKGKHLIKDKQARGFYVKIRPDVVK